MPLTAAEREAKEEAERQAAIEKDPSLGMADDKIAFILNNIQNLLLGLFTLGVMYFIARGPSPVEIIED